jgi:hypothetical protein
LFLPAYAFGADPEPVQRSAELPALLIGFEWERRPNAWSCPNADSVQRATEKVLARHPFVDREQANVSIRGTVAATSDGRAFEARLSLVAGDGTVVGERVLRSEGPNCATLADPLALVIGLAVDTLKQMPRTTLRIRTPKPKPEPWKGEVGPLAAAAWGLLPSTAVGFGLDGKVGMSSWWLDGTVSWFLPDEQQFENGPGGNFQALVASLSFCPTIVGPVVEFRICLGAMGARMSATGIALNAPQTQASWMAGASARTMLLWHIGPTVAVEPSLGVVLPFVRDRFIYTDQIQEVHPLYQPSAVLVSAQLAFPLRIF